MSTRSPHNPRYQKDAKLGKTRKSAASAKPKRSVGERGPGDGKGSGKGSGKGDRRRVEVISTPEIQSLRRRWWIVMGIALAAAAALLFPVVQESRILRSVAFGAWGASFFTALYIEWFKIRKLRKAEIERRKNESGGSGGGASGGKGAKKK